jgi:hypothetical protein
MCFICNLTLVFSVGFTSVSVCFSSRLLPVFQMAFYSKKKKSIKLFFFKYFLTLIFLTFNPTMLYFIRKNQKNINVNINYTCYK